VTEADAMSDLAVLTAAGDYPELTDADLLVLVRQNAVIDADGRGPSVDGWTPTFDLDRAAVAGWTLKAGKAAGDFDFTTAAGGFSRSQVVSSCLAMAATYRRRIVSMVSVGARDASGTGCTL